MTTPTRIPWYAWSAQPVGQPELLPLADPDALPEAPVVFSGAPDASSPVLAALKRLAFVYPSFFPPYDKAVLPFTFPLTNIPINVAPATAVILGQFSVPPGHQGRVDRFGVAGSDLSNLQWDFLIRGTPTPPITGLVLQYGLISSPTPIPGPGIVLSESDVCELRVTNIGGGIIANVQARADGYLWNATTSRT